MPLPTATPEPTPVRLSTEQAKKVYAQMAFTFSASFIDSAIGGPVGPSDEEWMSGFTDAGDALAAMRSALETTAWPSEAQDEVDAMLVKMESVELLVEGAKNSWPDKASTYGELIRFSLANAEQGLRASAIAVREALGMNTDLEGIHL